jgi:hyaluronan synthase
LGSDAFLLIVGLLISWVIRLRLSALVRIGNPAWGITRDYSYEPSVSVLLHWFNEGRAVNETMESICRSHYPRDKFEIVAIDDRSADDSFDWILKAQNEFSDVRILASRNIRNCGKAETQSNALKMSLGEVILCIDSDAVFDSAAIRELTACLADPRIGAVGGAVGVCNLNKNILTAAWRNNQLIISSSLLLRRRLAGGFGFLSGSLTTPAENRRRDAGPQVTVPPRPR